MLSRRRFLKSSSLLALAPSAPLFVMRTARAAGTDNHRRALVVVQLDGGNDAINTVVPHADPNYANAWMWRGSARAYLGDAERAIEDLQQALRLSPLDTTIWIAQTTMANAHFLRGRYEEALSWASMRTAHRSR